MIDPAWRDAIITWLAAGGCAIYLYFVLRGERPEGASRSDLFLLAVLTAILAIRGFYWLHESVWLASLVFTFATLLPLAFVLFAEQLLRRHHPLWLKLGAAAVTLFFFVSNLVATMAYNTTLLVAFLASMIFILGANGFILLREYRHELSAGEVRRVHAVLVAVLCTLPLVVTDFRETIGDFPVRLGGVGVLLFVYALLWTNPGRNFVLPLLLRVMLIALASLGLAATFSLSAAVPQDDLWTDILARWPVALSWTFLMLIAVNAASLYEETRSHSFLRWLLHARMDTVDGFLASLHRLAFASDHVVLGPEQLKDYDLNVLFETARSRREPIGADEAHEWARSTSDKTESGEQLVDLLQRHQMTHALFVRRDPPLIVLLNLPRGADRLVGQARAGIIQRIARRLASDPS